MVFWTTTLWVRLAATAVFRATSMRPPRPPKSKTRYDRPNDGPYCVRSPAGRRGLERASDRVADRSAVSDGKSAPRVAPYSSAADSACAQEMRVAGLFRRERSTTSANDSLARFGIGVAGRVMAGSVAISPDGAAQ